MLEGVAVVIPSLGAPSLIQCLAALEAQSRQPDRIIVVLSGSADPPRVGSAVTWFRCAERLGFAAAVNQGIRALPSDVSFVALLNDDAEPAPSWLGTLLSALKDNDALTAVQGTVVTTDNPPVVDGRGLAFDRLGLPVQVDRGMAPDDGIRKLENRLGVSATAAIFRRKDLDAVRLKDGSILDETFDSYHEDTDLALRLLRLGLETAWVPGASCRHLGSASGRRRSWRHPWWILANRWRALAGNLTPIAFGLSFPRLIAGEVRAVRTLARTNPRAIPVAFLVLVSLPFLKIQGWLRQTPGPRLHRLPLDPP
jgi:GT2 family glycosyltransferase